MCLTPAGEGEGEGEDSWLGAWADALGNYVVEGFCPGSGTVVSLVDMDGTLVLRFLVENDGASLMIDKDPRPNK